MNQATIANRINKASSKNGLRLENENVQLIEPSQINRRRSKRQQKRLIAVSQTQIVVALENGHEREGSSIVKLEPMEVLSSGEALSEADQNHTSTYIRNQRISSIEKVLQEMKLFSCDKCGEELENMQLLQQHFRAIHNIPGYVICCGRSYYRNFLLHDHIRFHMDKEAFKCQVCGRCYENRRSLAAHLRNSHVSPNQIVFECEVCGKGFRTKAIYEKHKVKHLGEEARVHECSLCGRKFKSDRYLETHIINFHKKQPQSYVCSVCGTTYSSKGALKAHFEIQHDDNFKKQNCDICGLYFTNVRTHKKRKHATDDNVSCNICHKVMANMYNLRGHMKHNHSASDTTYPCLICDKVFHATKYLQEHMSVHTGIKPYVCNFCPATFSCSGNKVKHHRNRHFNEWQKWRSERYSKPYRKKSDDVL